MKPKFPKIKKLLLIKFQSYYFSLSLVPEKTYRNERFCIVKKTDFCSNL